MLPSVLDFSCRAISLSMTGCCLGLLGWAKVVKKGSGVVTGNRRIIVHK